MAKAGPSVAIVAAAATAVATVVACGGRLATAPEGDGGSGGSSTSSGGSSGSGSGSGSASGGSSSSSGSSSGASGSSSGSASSSGSSSGTASSSGSSSGSGSGSSSGGPADGAVYFEQCAQSAICSQPQLFVYASFATPQNANLGCTVTTSGACSYYSCPSGGGVTMGLSAGALTVAGGMLAKTALMPGASAVYQYQANGTFFAAGTTLTAWASGATVPAFGPESVVAPALITLIAPATTSAIPTSTDLLVEWAGGEGGAQMDFEGVTPTGGSSQDYFDCTWDATAGHGTVPHAMLAPLSGQSGYVIYGQITTTPFKAGAYDIGVSAVQYRGDSSTFQ